MAATFSSRLSKQSPRSSPEPARPDALFFRRAVGFIIKISDAITVNDVELTQEQLRAWMSYNTFKPWTHDDALRKRLEDADLLYWSESADGRPTTGAPLPMGDDAQCTLRDGVGVTVALIDQNEIAPWPFMARRGELDDKKICGLRFSSAERGQEVYAVDFYAGPALRRLIADPRPDPLLTVLNDCGLLSVQPPKMRLMPGQVAWLGHAAVLVRAGDATVLVDPLFIRRSDPPEAYVEPAFDWRTLPPIDAIAITHADNDHLNPGSLARLPPNIPVIVPGGPKHPYQVDLERTLDLLGFKYKVGPTRIKDVTITPHPFHGEDWGLQLQKATYTIEGPLGRVYLSADSLNPPEVFDAIGPVDFAFLGVSGCEEPLIAPKGFGYGEFYADWLPHHARNHWQRFTMNAKDAARAADRLQAKRVFGYAAGGGSFMDMAHADQGTHAELAALTPRAYQLRLGIAAPIR